jgi:hypothetical protein
MISSPAKVSVASDSLRIKTYILMRLMSFPPAALLQRDQNRNQSLSFLERAKGFADRELNQIRRKVEEHRDELLRAWHEHFGA